MKDEKAKEVKKEKKDDISSVVHAQGRILNKVVKFLEEIHGADINDDGRVGFARISTMLVSCVLTLFIGFGVVVAENVDDKSAGTGTYSLDQASVGTGVITLTVDAVVADVTGDVTSTGLSTKTPTSASVTNAEAYTVVSDVTILNGIGGANDTTNTITLANPTEIGNYATIVVAGASSNLIGLADSGNLKLSAAAVLDNNDAIVLYAAEAAVWVEVSRSDN